MVRLVHLMDPNRTIVFRAGFRCAIGARYSPQPHKKRLFTAGGAVGYRDQPEGRPRPQLTARSPRRRRLSRSFVRLRHAVGCQPAGGAFPAPPGASPARRAPTGEARRRRRQRPPPARRTGATTWAVPTRCTRGSTRPTPRANGAPPIRPPPSRTARPYALASSSPGFTNRSLSIRCCRSCSSRYRPPSAISSACVPRSTTFPSSSTRI